ncbi:MAG: GNAT family N-acetyltransferase [Clostridia bacterium]|nr:GNAT family N-acetyltransferase [Clostridia bacterium]
MEVIRLNENYLKAFKTYMETYKLVHDESYLYPDDIEEFSINEKNPTYLLLENNQIIGCLSLMLMDYFVAGEKTRVRIFHCKNQLLEHYQLLWNAMEALPKEVKKVELFIPDSLPTTIEIFKQLSFEYYRTAYVMVRENQPDVSFQFPEDFSLKTYRTHEDAKNYAFVRNKAFQFLKGSEVPITEDIVIELSEEPYMLENGIQLLWHNEQPVGVIRMTKEEDHGKEYSFVAPIALLPEYQGRGLGYELLKAGIALGEKNNLKNTMLSVNAENRDALKLYFKTGFEVDMALSCLQAKISS